MIDFTYLTQQPARYTFEMPQLKKWVESWCRGKVLNLFGGKIRFETLNEISNDIDITMPTDYHIDALDFVCNTQEKFDSIILDPPYNWRKAKEKYESRFIGKYPVLKDAILNILYPHARVITLGYDTVGMSASRKFEKIAICLVCHNGDHHDTLCLVEELNSPEPKLDYEIQNNLLELLI